MKFFISLMVLAFLTITSSTYAYQMYDNNGKEFGGRCDAGGSFAGIMDNEGWYTVTGSNGTHYGKSISSVIQKACGE